jgi:drug/metabolite transporter (DMT)-like permease
MDWRLLAFTVPLMFVSFQSLSKLIPKSTSSFLVTCYALVVGAVLMLSFFLATSADKPLRLTGKSLALAIGIGALLGLGNYGVIKAYSLGAPQSTFTPLMYVILIVYGIIFGYLFFHEKLHMMQLAGVIIALVGVFMIVHFKK